MATGMAMILYRKAQKRFLVMTLKVRSDILMLSRAFVIPPLMTTMSALSMARSIPEPMAIPISAPLRAAASLMPSPIMRTFLPWA